MDYRSSAASHWKPYERASILASLIAPNLLVGRPAVAMDIWAKLREPSIDSVSFWNACIEIGSDCFALKQTAPEELIAAIEDC